MPYIDADRRMRLDAYVIALQQALGALGCREGDLNYVVSRLVGYYFRAEPRYHTIARVRGVLADVSSEFYRRVAGRYEDGAIERSGDIPEYAPPRALKPLTFPNYPVYPTEPAVFNAPEGALEAYLEFITLEHSTQRIFGHPASKCKGRPCTLHNRSNHHMRAWPQVWRDDAQLMERTCPHGVGHPDPDDLKAGEYRHGCDGCCRP